MKWTTPLLLFSIAATSFLLGCANEGKDEAKAPVPSRPELTELFRIGNETDGKTTLFASIGELVAVDGSSRIFVGEQQEPKIYMFTAEGTLIKTIGQEGNGPGEFQRIASVHIGPADTLYVFDSSLERMSVYEPDEMKLAYELTVSQDSLGLSYWLVGVLDTGFLLTYGWPISPGDAVADRLLYVMRIDWTGQIIRPPVHHLPAAEWLVSAEGEDRFAVRMPFGRKPVLRTGSGGKLYAGWTESVDIAVISPNGVQSKIVSHALTPIPLTRQEVHYYVGESSDWYREVVLAADLAATKPAFENFVVDDLERIWMKITPHSVVDTIAQWLIFDKESRLHGQVQLPMSINLRVIRQERAYAEHSEEASLIVYQVRE